MALTSWTPTGSLMSEPIAMPAALQWKGIAEIIAKGLQGLQTSALIVMALAALAAVLIEGAKLASPDRIRLWAVSVGPGVVRPPESTFAMFAGSLVFWPMGSGRWVLADGPASQDCRHLRPPLQGERQRADLRRVECERCADGHSQYQHQCDVELS